MTLPLSPPLEPMLAKAVSSLPGGDGWLYEPKWDGFRAIVFRDGDDVFTQSRDLKPLDRYFPELGEPFRAQLPERCVLDGEVVIAGTDGLAFEALLLRIHPAASRVRLLAAETPASFVAWDLLALGDEDLRGVPQGEGNSALELSSAPDARDVGRVAELSGGVPADPARRPVAGRRELVGKGERRPVEGERMLADLAKRPVDRLLDVVPRIGGVALDERQEGGEALVGDALSVDGVGGEEGEGGAADELAIVLGPGGDLLLDDRRPDEEVGAGLVAEVPGIERARPGVHLLGRHLLRVVDEDGEEPRLVKTGRPQRRGKGVVSPMDRL